MYYLQDNVQYTVRPEYVGRDIIVAIDSSKTDSAFFVADKFGNILNDYDICGLKSDDIYWQTYEQRKFLKTLFSGSNIILGGIEDVITKKTYGSGDKEKSYRVSRGMEEHQSRLKITLVYASFISVFQDCFDYTLEPVNNWSWKTEILPEEYRTRDHHKGSQDWHNDMHTAYAGRNDNITDAWCILQYLLKKHNISRVVPVSNDVEDMKQCKYSLLSSKTNMAGHIEYRYNASLSIEQNIAFLSNRLKDTKVANFFRVPISALNIKDIYAKCYGTFLREERELIIMVYKGT